jgi:hypothetical protein
MGIKSNNTGLGMLGQKIAPEEIDRYEVYNINWPNFGNQWAVGTALIAGTSTDRALIFNTVLADYPRNIEGVLLGTHGNMEGTFVVNGKDQFGKTITENLAITKAANGGTTAGTKVFAQFTSGTFVSGTFLGNGTVKLGYGTSGTTCLFGLPVKIAGTTDVVKYSWNIGTGALNVNGGTIGAFVGTQYHCIKAPLDLVGSIAAQVWVKPTYNAVADPAMANLTLRV